MGERIERERIRTVHETHRAETQHARAAEHVKRLQVGEKDRALIRTFQGENRFERGNTADLVRQPKPLEGVPVGLKANAVNFGGGAIGFFELYAGLTFKVNKYFRVVTDKIARSSRPEGDDLKQWKGMGYDAIVSLTAETTRFTEAAKAEGLHTLWIPIIDNTARGKFLSRKDTQDHWMDQQIFKIAKFILTHDKTVLHCQAGIGRTGMVVASLRILLDNWTADQAIKEMLDVAQKENRVKRIVAVPAQVEYVRGFAARVQEAKRRATEQLQMGTLRQKYVSG